MMSKISEAIAVAYPDVVHKCDGTPFIRPAWTGDTHEYVGGYYWENMVGDRFYFETFEAAAEDVARDMAFYETEADSILAENQYRATLEAC
jgi:hypothetical protein